MQLTLFEMEPSFSDLERRVEAIHQKTEKVRRGIYAEHSELKKMYFELKHEFETLKVAISNTAKSENSMEYKCEL